MTEPHPQEVTDGGMDAPTEADSERDGAFSYAGEWHAFAHGFRSGVASVAPGPHAGELLEVAPEKLENESYQKRIRRQLRRESWYVTGGFVAGVVFGLLVYGVGASLFL